MSFDAGSIQAELTVKTDKFYSDLEKAKAKLDDLTKNRTIKISAVFESASLSKARKMFADLDNMISRDAAQRLKSSPQGSVLGALNSLFSPHPVTGAPSAQASSQGGLLGKMISGQGGGGPTGTAGAAGRNTSSTNAVRNILTGPQPGNTSTTDQIKQVLTGQGAQDAQTTDRIKQVLTGTAPGNVNTEDIIKRVVTGAAPGNIETTDTIKEKIDPASKAQVVKDSADSGDKSGASFSASFLGHIKSLFSDIGKMGGGGSGGSGSGSGGLAAGILGGIGPGIAGMSAKVTGIIGAVGSALATLPALAGVAGTGLGVALIGGAVAAVIKTSPALKAQFKTIGTDAEAMFKTAAQPLIPAISAVLKQVPALLKTIGPQLSGIFKEIAPQIQGIFTGLIPVINGVLGIMKAAAPAFGPVIQGLETLIANILPGIQVVIKAMVPFLSQFAGILATLGKNLGSFFAAAAPAIGASMKVLSALLDVVGGLLPVIMKLAGVLATALAPVFTQLAGVIKSLMPFLTIIGNVFAALAQAVLGDLVSAFTALARLLVAIAPSLAAFATAISGVFTVLENTGVFAILGDALEALVPPLAKLINALLAGLTPLLPPIIGFIGQLSGILIGGLVQAVMAVLPPLTTLAVTVLGAIAQILPVVLPLLVSMAGIFTGAVVTLIQGVASGLTSIVNAIPPNVILGLVAAFYAFRTAVLLTTAAQWLLNTALLSNPIGIVVVALAAIAAAFYVAWQKSAGFRDVIKTIGVAFLAMGIVVVQAAQALTDSVLSAFGSILHGAVDAFGWVPGIGGKLKTASAAFDSFKTSVDNSFSSAISTMQGWQQELATDSSKGAASLKTIEDAFTSQDKAAGDAKTALDLYTASVQQNGVTSAAAQAARAQLITDLTNAGVNSVTAQADVTNYTNAIAQNGASSSAAQAARQQLITDILNASTNARTGTTDLGTYTTAVQNNGTQSDAAKAARQQLITDLENAGVSAKTATGLVNDLGNGIKGLPAGKNINIDVTAQGTWTVTGLQALLGMNTSAGGLKPTPTGAQTGGIVGGNGSGDTELYMLESGEVIIPRKLRNSGFFASVIAPWLKKMGVPGFQGGGVASSWVDNDYDSTESNAVKDMESKFLAALKGAAASAAAAAISTAGVSNTSAELALQSAAAKMGWTGQQWQALFQVEMREAGFSLTAQNPSSGAYGMAQFINGPSEYAQYGGNSTTAAGQATAMVNYIAQRYGTPAAAWAHELAFGWYDQGGMITEPVIGFGTQTGRGYGIAGNGPEMVTPVGKGGASLADVVARLERLIATTAAVPAGVGHHMGAAIGGASAAASFRQRYPRGGT